MSRPTIGQKNGQSLRFAALRRVSTERQEKTGESLRTQTTEIEQAVAQLHGKIVTWYGGQEHGTPGFEKKEVDRLISDAAKGKFNAVIVTNADRWSRDNTKSQQGLEVFKKHKVHFYVGLTNYDLFNPTQLFYLEMSATIGKFQARNQSHKSVLSRIHRAKRNIPTCGALPFGRTFDRTTEKWGIDKDKQAVIRDIAKRYLTGESVGDLATEYSLDQSGVYKTLVGGCGEDWSQTFHSEDANIHEVIQLKIPRLLPDAMIARVRKRCAANKTIQGPRKYQNLLGHFVFCADCGYALTPQMNHSGVRCYRHAHHRYALPHGPTGLVKADVLEENVMRHLFETFGNPKAVQAAIKAATPNQDKVQALRAEMQRVEKQLKEIKAGKERIVGYVEKGTLSETEVTARMAKLRDREARLQTRLAMLDTQLEHVPSANAIKAVARKLTRERTNPRLIAAKTRANSNYTRMTWDEKRHLLESVFDGTTPDGKRAGVYIQWLDGNQRPRKWRYSILGTINETKLLPRSLAWLNEQDEQDPYDGIDCVSDSVHRSVGRRRKS
jgi:site-specific DNA recombinase